MGLSSRSVQLYVYRLEASVTHARAQRVRASLGSTSLFARGSALARRELLRSRRSRGNSARGCARLCVEVLTSLNVLSLSKRGNGGDSLRHRCVRSLPPRGTQKSAKKPEGNYKAWVVLTSPTGSWELFRLLLFTDLRAQFYMQEGLSPNHLKKAKLMFFYTRYPSSNMLKTYFSDVKFNRCITSQLIKWFSNFREFYYIQMEKYARQAINDGVVSTDELSITRDCELYRALNMHYNKANDFEVPERFLEVAQITLREFFNAIIAGKDVDPSWKKAIYKVICKLDSEVPEIFKSPNCLQELLHE
ncbi:hypothetical protein NDU88_010233 [Pleurodeles waltl]|uniref:Prospero domain-containing protein n=1 Tax=Pleurodeles waltl TaxID=8319 RepID=A0AAV7S0R0_PLEWA|nr:hypothetical protein NDU88_010233 [Pleurodeles waltl]